MLLGDVFFGELLLQLISSILKLGDKVVEALIDVPGLLVIQPLDFLFYVLNELSIVVVDPLGVQH